MDEWASQVALVVRNLLANAGDIRHTGSIPGSWSDLTSTNGWVYEWMDEEMNEWMNGPTLWSKILGKHVAHPNENENLCQ